MATVGSLLSLPLFLAGSTIGDASGRAGEHPILSVAAAIGLSAMTCFVMICVLGSWISYRNKRYLSSQRREVKIFFIVLILTAASFTNLFIWYPDLIKNHPILTTLGILVSSRLVGVGVVNTMWKMISPVSWHISKLVDEMLDSKKKKLLEKRYDRECDDRLRVSLTSRFRQFNPDVTGKVELRYTSEFYSLICQEVDREYKPRREKLAKQITKKVIKSINALGDVVGSDAAEALSIVQSVRGDALYIKYSEYYKEVAHAAEEAIMKLSSPS